MRERDETGDVHCPLLSILTQLSSSGPMSEIESKYMNRLIIKAKWSNDSADIKHSRMRPR